MTVLLEKTVTLLKAAALPVGTERLWADGFVYVKQTSGEWKKTNRRKLRAKGGRKPAKPSRTAEKPRIARGSPPARRKGSTGSQTPVGGRKAATAPSRTKKQGSASGRPRKTKGPVFSTEEGVVRWNKHRGVLQISIVGPDGRMKARTYKGEQKPGRKASPNEVALYRAQEVRPGAGGRVLQDGTIVVRDGEKKFVLRNPQGDVQYFRYRGAQEPMAHGLVTPANILPQELVARYRDLYFGDEVDAEKREYPEDYSDLQPSELAAWRRAPRRRFQRPPEEPPAEIRDFDDDKPLNKLLQKLSDNRFEITLSRMAGSKTGRPWVKGSVVKIGNRFFQVRYHRDVDHGGYRVRQYTLRRATATEYATRPIRMLVPEKKALSLEPQQVKRLTNGQHFRVTSVTEREDQPGTFVVTGNMIPPKEGRAVDREQDKARKEARQQAEMLYHFKQSALLEEDDTVYRQMYENYLLERSDKITNIEIAKDKLREATDKKMTARTIRAREKKLQEAEAAFEGYGEITDENPKAGFDPPFKRLARDITRGEWLGYRGKVYYMDNRFRLFTTKTSAKAVAAAVRSKALLPALKPLSKN